ncbi:MAG: nitrate reductase [Deltaproteobacteria bacterium]|nr:nitrate reductase [Deltaproteobacteria bacterium]
MTEKTLRSTCGYCSTGCRLTVDAESMKVIPDPDYPVNKGSACPKGFLFLEPLKAEDRATSPLMKNARGELFPTNWDSALEAFVENFQRIQTKHGKASVAFLGTGQLPVEEIAFLGALAKFGMGMVHGDGNTRQCMATAVAAYKESFGFDAPPFTYNDFEESDVLVFIGANPAIAHPIMWGRVKKNPNNPQIVLIDPRKTETVKRATLHYQIRPDSLLTLLYGIAHLLVKNGWIDSDYISVHTVGFHDFCDHVKQFDPRSVSKVTGILEKDLLNLVKIIHEGKRVSFWWTMGVNQNYQAVPCAQAIINLALMTGNIGRPGTGANSITGQANAMGSRLFSNTTSLLGGHDFLNPAHRKKVARILGIDAELIPKENSLAYDQILQAVESGQIKGLWVVCTNPAHSWINKTWLFKILKKLKYLVVQDMYDTTETAQLADLVLPAAACGEKEGTFVNSERRIGVIRKIMDPPGSALPDFEIFKRIAQYWGCAEMFKEWTSPAAVFDTLKKVTKGRPCDISGIESYETIESQGGIQWPFPEGSRVLAQERRLFEDGKFYHPDQKARFMFADVMPVPEKEGGDYPLILLTGRGSVAQWHTQTRTGKVDMLKKMYPADPYVVIHQEDANTLGIQPDDWVIVSSRRGEVRARVAVAESVSGGVVFMSMHYFETNWLTYPAFDPQSREPSYKYASVSIRPA